MTLKSYSEYCMHRVKSKKVQKHTQKSQTSSQHRASGSVFPFPKEGDVLGFWCVLEMSYALIKHICIVMLPKMPT